MAVSAMDKRYAMLRQNLQQQETQQSQAETDALRRRFASMGALGSGAAMKSEQKAREASAQRLMQGQGQLDIARLGEEQTLEESQRAREFATAERLGGQQFAAEQAGLSRQFQTSERLGGQGFAAEQAGLNRQFQTSERLGGQDFSAAEAALNRKFTTSERMAGQEYLTGENQRQYKQASYEKDLDRRFTAGQAEKDRIARAADIVKQLNSQEKLAELARNVQVEMFNKEFDINKLVTAYNMGWRPSSIQASALPGQLGVSIYSGGSFPGPWSGNTQNVNNSTLSPITIRSYSGYQ